MLFNLIPGQGLGFSSSRDLAYSLVGNMPVYYTSEFSNDGGGYKITVIDNPYVKRGDEKEILDILMVLRQVIK